MTDVNGLLSRTSDSLEVRLYGDLAPDMRLLAGEGKQTDPISRAYPNQALSFAWICGVRIFGKCRRLPVPLIAVVPGPGTEATECDEFAKHQMWTLPLGAPLVTLTHAVGPAERIAWGDVHALVNVDSDFRLHDVRTDGTRVSGALRSYLRLRQPGPFGTTLFDITVVDRDDAFSIDVLPNLCVTVFDIGIARAQICFHPNPNRVCGEVVIGLDLPVVGHWGQTFAIACVNI